MQIEIVQILGTIMPIEAFFDPDTDRPISLGLEFEIPDEEYSESEKFRVLHALEHPSPANDLSCWFIKWNGKDTIILGKPIGRLEEIGWGSQLKISAEELSSLTEEVQKQLDALNIDQRMGVFLYTTHQFV